MLCIRKSYGFSNVIQTDLLAPSAHQKCRVLQNSRRKGRYSGNFGWKAGFQSVTRFAAQASSPKMPANLEILVEEESAEAALWELLPKILGAGAQFRIHSHQGKQNLLKRLESRLRGYAHWIGADHLVVVLVDRDKEDCRILKRSLEDATIRAGLRSKTAAAGEPFEVLNRIVVEELEAWFLGDPEAIRAAYPRVSRSVSEKHGGLKREQEVGRM